MKRPIVILPRYYADRIAACDSNSGLLDIRADEPASVYLVDGFTRGRDGGGHHGGSHWAESHYVAHAPRERRALWYRAEPELHAFGFLRHHRSGALPLDHFRAGLHGSWTALGRNGQRLVVTYAHLDEGGLDWRAWVIAEGEDKAQFVDIELVDEHMPLLAPLAAHWPLHELATAHVVVIGTGSIGSHANDALAAYGIRQLTLVDPDRLRAHNFSRHRAHPAQLGRFKVVAERERLRERDPDLVIDALTLDVVYDADAMRPLFAEADLVLCASDGIDPRRTVNHLARRAGTPAVFACVLENGAFGEILRVASPRTGCLLCARAHLREQGGMAPEHTLDRGYGEGSRHLPMTAVGSDLGLVGQLAAKTAVATILDHKGHRDQRLPGDHAILGLRPLPGMAAPFDLTGAGRVEWHLLPPPRQDCPTCGAAA